MSFIRQDWQPKPAFQLNMTKPQPQPAPQKTSGRGGPATAWISEAAGAGSALGGAALGATLGSVVPGIGTAIGGIAGGIIGGFTGGFGGRAAENKIRDDEYRVGDALTEGLISGAFGGFGQTAKIGGKAVGKIVGNRLLGSADDLAVKQFRLTPTQLKNFSKKFGKDAGGVIRQYGFSSSDDIASKGIAPLQQQFDNAVAGIGKVNRSALKKNIDSAVAKLSKSGTSDKRALAEQLKKEGDDLLRMIGKEADPKQVNAFRQEFDSLVNYTDRMANPARYNVNKRMADILRTTLQESDKSGTLKSVGKELQMLRQLSDNVAQQGQLGRGSLPLNLPTMLGGATGGAAGGPVGAAGTALGTAIVNSSAGRRAALKGIEKVGNRLVSNAAPSKLGQAGRVVAGMTGRGLVNQSNNQIGQSGSALGQSSFVDANSATSPMNIPSSTNPTNVNNMTSPYTNTGGLSSGYPQAQNPYPVENFMYDVQRDPQNADEYYKLYQMYQEVLAQPETGGMADLSQSSRNALASSDNAINTVNQLEQLFTNAGSGSGRIGGTIKGWAASAGFDENARIYDSLANASVTQIAKALAGSGAGTVSDMDAKVIMAALPTLRDTPAEARAKFEALRQRLDNAKQNTLLYGGAESESQSLESALMQAQGAY